MKSWEFILILSLSTIYTLQNYKENLASFSQPPSLNLQLKNKQHEYVYYDKPHPHEVWAQTI
jgi:hypothetical protein